MPTLHATPTTIAAGLLSSDLLTDEAWNRIAVYPGFWICDTCGKYAHLEDAAYEAGCDETDTKLIHFTFPCLQNLQQPRCPGTMRMPEGEAYMNEEAMNEPDTTRRFYAQGDIVIREGYMDHGLVIEHSPYYTLCPESEPVDWVKSPQGALDPGYESTLPMIPTYCLPADWFPGGIAPYDVYAVAEPSHPITSCAANTRALYATIRATLSPTVRDWNRGRETHKDVVRLLASGLP